jgi:hypothetical protein
MKLIILLSSLSETVGLVNLKQNPVLLLGFVWLLRKCGQRTRVQKFK